MKRKNATYLTSRIKHRTNGHASSRLISDLIFKARQRRMWAACFSKTPAVAEAHMKKHREAVKALRTLGYTDEI